MAKVRTNPVFEELTGSIGELVIKRAASGRLYVSRKPQYPPDRAFSAAQVAHQQRFRAAAAYARQAAKTEPIYAERARQTRQPAYNVALSDYLRPPAIVAVERTDEALRVHAEDNVKVTRVVMTVLDAEGQVLATGEATPEAATESAEGWWRYPLPMAAARVQVSAFDLAGNETKWEG